MWTGIEVCPYSRLGNETSFTTDIYFAKKVIVC